MLGLRHEEINDKTKDDDAGPGQETKLDSWTNQESKILPSFLGLPRTLRAQATTKVTGHQGMCPPREIPARYPERLLPDLTLHTLPT